MQNKGFVKVIAVLLSVICLFYLSFSLVTNSYQKKADAYANGKMANMKFASANDREKAFNDFRGAYLDSMRNEEVYLFKTLKECEQLQIGLGLDLRGGMNVILEVSVADVVKNSAGSDKTVQQQVKAAADAAEAAVKKSGDDFLNAFVAAYEEQNGANKLAGAFSGLENITPKSTDNQVKAALSAKIEAAVANGTAQHSDSEGPRTDGSDYGGNAGYQRA